MLPVIIGKSKIIPDPMPSNLLVVGGSFTGRLKIYDRDTLQEVTGVDTSAMTAINSLAYDADYIYVGGNFTAAPHARKISRATKGLSVLHSTYPNRAIGNNCVAVDESAVYTFSTLSSTVSHYKIPFSGGFVFQSIAGYSYNAAQNDTHIFRCRQLNTQYYIHRTLKLSYAVDATLILTGSGVRSLTVDSNFLYFGSTTSGDFHVYDLALTTEQTGYPTIPGDIYSILNDATNVYIGSSGGNLYVINKATKALATIATGLGAYIISLSQTSDLLYASSASGIVKIGKSNLSTVYSVLSGLSSINTIMVI